MPLVQIKGVGGYLTLEQKQEMIRKVTNAVLVVEGEGLPRKQKERRTISADAAPPPA